MITFLVITLVFSGIIAFYAQVPKPFLHLASFGFYTPLLLTIVFIFMVGHEIVSTLLQIIANSGQTKTGRNLFHFLIISIIYLLNIVLVYLRGSHILNAKIYLVDSFIILVVAAILGIWGYRKREITYESTYSFYPHGACLYLVLGIMTMITISYGFVTANDAVLESIEDAVLYSQLGYSSMFIVYVIANFYTLLYQNVNVGKVVYKPLRMPYFTARFAGIIVIMALFLKDNMVSYYQARAGFYIGIADLYAMNDDYLSAREYYNLAEVYALNSHRANYAMASLEKSKNDFKQELQSLKNAVIANPTEYAYVNLANAYMRNNAYFDAIFTLNEGLEKFPHSGPILNNMGLLYTKTGALDSTYQYFQAALKIKKSHDASTTNIFSFLNTKNLSIRKDTLDYLFEKIHYLPADNNLVVLANRLNVPAKDSHSIRFDKKDFRNLIRIVYNYNKMLNQPSLVDSTLVNSLSDFFSESPYYWMYDPLKVAGAFANFKNHQISDAFNTLNSMQSGDDTQAYQDASYLGKMSLALGAPRLAIDYLSKAMDGGIVLDAPELAFAYMENGDLDKASFMWRQIANNNTGNYGNLAKDMIKILSITNVRQALDLDENLRYHFIHFRFHEFDPDEIQGLILSFDNDNYRASATLDIIKMFLQTKQTGKASELINKLQNINITSPDIYRDYLKTTMEFCIEVKNYDLLEQLLQDKNMKDEEMHEYAQLAQAVTDQFKGNFDEAEKSFKMLGYKDPFFEKSIETAVNYFNQNNHNVNEAYNILLNAININRYSVPINEAYILQCLKMGLTDYAEEGLENMKQFVDPTTFEEFQTHYNQAYQEMMTRKESW